MGRSDTLQWLVLSIHIISVLTLLDDLKVPNFIMLFLIRGEENAEPFIYFCSSVLFASEFAFSCMFMLH